jgi:hypothetical protein
MIDKEEAVQAALENWLEEEEDDFERDVADKVDELMSYLESEGSATC